uniref:Apple domain-containing protein n=1 Tax=Plectus sambesii TaxID=2011161 RepID=A0A914VJP6_9BILA
MNNKSPNHGVDPRVRITRPQPDPELFVTSPLPPPSLPSLPVAKVVPSRPSSSSEAPAQVIDIAPKGASEVSPECCGATSSPGADCCRSSVDPVSPSTASSIPSLPPAAGCSAYSYFVIIGQELALPQGPNGTDLTGVMGPNGEEIECASMNYFPQSQTCEIHQNAASPRGSGHLITNEEVIYVEKFCQPSGINAAHKCSPDELYLMHTGQRIVGHELSASTSLQTVESCLEVCLADAACKSASYNSQNRQCELHDTNLGETPEALRAAEGWTLVENGCAKGGRVKISSPEGKTKNTPPAPSTPLKASGSDIDRQPPLDSPFSKPVKQITVDDIRRAEAKNKVPKWPAKNISEQPSTQNDWSAWTPCQFVVKGHSVRVRTRKCTFGSCPQEDMQVERCKNSPNER